MTDAPNPRPEDKEPAEGSRETVDAALDDDASEPTPVTPASVKEAPSSTGVVAGDPDEPEVARDDGRE